MKKIPTSKVPGRPGQGRCVQSVEMFKPVKKWAPLRILVQFVELNDYFTLNFSNF